MISPWDIFQTTETPFTARHKSSTKFCFWTFQLDAPRSVCLVFLFRSVDGLIILRPTEIIIVIVHCVYCSTLIIATWQYCAPQFDCTCSLTLFGSGGVYLRYKLFWLSLNDARHGSFHRSPFFKALYRCVDFYLNWIWTGNGDEFMCVWVVRPDRTLYIHSLKCVHLPKIKIHL